VYFLRVLEITELLTVAALAILADGGAGHLVAIPT
jgi:hypothetical protein